MQYKTATMRTGEDNRDLTALEKAEGQKAARELGRQLRTLIARSTVKQSGEALKSKATARMKYDALDSITIGAPHYIFKQHYGFEGIKSNRVHMTLKPTNVFNLLLDNNKTLDQLIDAIGNLRAEQVTSKIRF